MKQSRGSLTLSKEIQSSDLRNQWTFNKNQDFIISIITLFVLNLQKRNRPLQPSCPYQQTIRAARTSFLCHNETTLLAHPKNKTSAREEFLQVYVYCS